MTIGTAYFVTMLDAVRYFGAEAAIRKVKSGEIHIGKPQTKEGDKLIQKEGRWHIQYNN